MPPTMQIKRGTAAALASVNPTPLAGELVWDSTNNTLRVGNGSSAYSSLSVVSATPTSHSHGNITNAGAIGSTANLPIITTTSGVLTTGSFGSSAATFCVGNDSRLSDTRTPTDGSVTTAKLANDAVTYAKLQNVSATDRLLGRSSAGAGDVEEVTCTAAGRALLSGADAAAQRTTLSVQPTASPAFTGAATFTAASGGSSVPVTITNEGTGNSFVVNDAPATDSTPFVINASGDVAIGTSSPSAKLDVHGTIRCGAGSTDPGTGAVMYLVGSGFFQTVIAGAAFGVHTGGNDARTERFFINGSGVSTFSGQLLVTTGSGSAGSYKPGIAVSGDDDTGIQQVGGANTISLVTAGSERVRVDASGHVGIGATPSFRLDVLGSANCVAKIKTSAAGSFGCLQIHNANTNGETSIGFRDDSDSDASSWVIGKSVGGVADAFGFYYNGNRAIIESDGVVKLPDVYEDTVGATNRDLFIDNAGKLGYVSSIRASKTNIAAIDDVSWLRDLTPVSFHYRKRNEDGTYSDEADGTLDYGLIAEEVEPVAPEMCFYDVVDGEPQLRGVHYSKLITPMLRYIQQLEARIAALEERVNHA